MCSVVWFRCGDFRGEGSTTFKTDGMRIMLLIGGSIYYTSVVRFQGEGFTTFKTDENKFMLCN